MYVYIYIYTSKGIASWGPGRDAALQDLQDSFLGHGRVNLEVLAAAKLRLSAQCLDPLEHVPYGEVTSWRRFA